MFVGRWVRLLAIAMVVGGLVGCTQPREPDPPGTVAATGALELPTGTDPGSVKLIAGFNEGQVDDSGNAYEISLNPEAVQLLSVVDEAGRTLQMSVRSIGSIADPEPLGPESTAEALIFLNPFLVTSDPNEAEARLAQIRSLGSFADVVDRVRLEQQANTFDWTSPSAELQALLAAAFAEIQATVGPANLNLIDLLLQPQVDTSLSVSPGFSLNGLQIVDVAEGTHATTFAMTNYLKRYISVYVDPSADAMSFTRSSAPEAFLASPDISIFGLLQGAYEGDLMPRVTSGTMTLDTSAYDAFEVKAYGLGIAGWNLSPTDGLRMLAPAIMSGVFDIALPMIEVAAGFKMAPELRGRPTDHPFHSLVQAIVEQNSDGTALVGKGEELYQAMRTGRVDEVAVKVITLVVEEVIRQPRLVADLINQVAVELGGQAVLRRSVEAFMLPLRVVNQVMTVVNIAYAFGSIISTETVTTFVVSTGSGDGVDLATLAGRVVDASDTGRPVVDATVTAIDASGNLVAAGQTDTGGQYEFSVVPGDLTLRFTAYGYQSVERTVIARLPASGGVQYVSDTALPPFSRETGSVGGQVLDATNRLAVEGVGIELRPALADPGAAPVATASSTASGHYVFDGLPVGAYTATFWKAGYVDDTLAITVVGGQSLGGYDMRLVPEIVAEQGYRIVLTWGVEPRDLDSHLFTPEIGGSTHHVYYANRGSLDAPPYAVLDVDDVSSYGPETISIAEAFPGTYAYSVYLYSGLGDLTTSNAQVVLYDQSGLVNSWSVPLVGSGRWWRVFTLDGATGAVTTIDEIGTVGTSGHAVEVEAMPAKLR